LGRLGKGLLVACVAVSLIPAAASAAPPQIKASWVKEVTATGTKMWMELNPNGSSTTYYFEYISDAAYRANPPLESFAGAAKTASATTIGTTFIQVPRETSGALSPATTYHYRPVASHSGGAEKVVGAEHSFTTKDPSEPSGLPDGRGWEMVSPVDKGGGAIAAPEELFGGGDLQAAASSPVVTYGSGTAFDGATGAPPVSQYVSRREPFGWITENISTPLQSGAYGDRPDGAPYRVFSSDLSRGLLFGGLACRGGLEGCPAPNQPLPGTGAPAGYMAYYLRQGGQLTSLLSAADVAHSVPGVSPSEFEVSFAAAAADLSHIVLSSCAALSADTIQVPDGPGKCDPDAQNLYDRSAAGLEAINLLPGASVGTPGAAIAAAIGAVSGDGSRIYWTVAGGLYLREGAETIPVDQGLGGGGAFQAASADGSVAFFTKAGHLYRFTAADETATDLTPAGGVAGVLGASADGGYVYFQDAAGLELWHGGAIVPVAEAGPGTTLPSDYPPARATARVSADGLHLAFLSKAELTGFDNIDARTGLPDVELYIYGASAGGGASSLICASCNPSGERPEGSASIPGALVNGSTRAYLPRALSADGSRLFFETDDRVWGKDTNGRTDVYEWEAQGAGACAHVLGCATPVSDAAHGGGQFIDASADGTDVYFLTGDSLVKADPGSVDLYDARVGGGFPAGSEQVVCIGDGCQSLPREPEDPTPGTLVPNPGNPPEHIFGPKKKPKHHKKRHKGPRGGKHKHRKGGRSGGRTR
jgi:hypothetical protein